MDSKSIERVYTGYAKVYNRIFGTIFQRSREAAIRDLNVQSGERVLEIGVGTGLCLPLYPRDCQITGIDLSDGMLDRARKLVRERRLSNVRLMRMDAGALEFPDGSFDTVVAAYVVTAVPDHRAVMSEVIRVCRPGGRIMLLITSPTTRSLSPPSKSSFRRFASTSGSAPICRWRTCWTAGRSSCSATRK
jgi:phosphatidylethanolamine/phosphatidyl-N-methylethanolamine N-methyltransferase